jgi:hypothetical protein
MIPDVAGSLDRDLAARWERLEARPDRWLSLAAAPTFAMMALLTWIYGGGMPDILCSAAQGASPLTGMVAMYSLMSAIHLAPWLRLLSRRRRVSRTDPAPSSRAAATIQGIVGLRRWNAFPGCDHSEIRRKK